MIASSRNLPRIAGGATPSAAAAKSDKGLPAKGGPFVVPATIAVYSVKGGVGKTTIAANLAWCAAASQTSTLLWDLDASGGAGFLYGVEPAPARPAEAIFDKTRAPLSLVKHTEWPGLDVLPADESLRALDSRLLHIGKRKRIARLTETLGAAYSRIVIDCPPVLNELSAQILRAADAVIVPLPPSPLSARALDLVVREVRAHGRGHPPILPVLSMLDMRRTLHRDARAANPSWPAIPYASAVEQGAVRQKPVGAIAADSPAADGFAQLWSMIEARLAARRPAKGK